VVVCLGLFGLFGVVSLVAFLLALRRFEKD